MWDFCAWRFTLERLSSSLLLLDVPPMLSMFAMGLINNNNRLILIPVDYIILVKSYCLIYKIVSLKYPILDIYFPRGYV